MHEKQATSLSSSFTPTRIKLKKENRNTKKRTAPNTTTFNQTRKKSIATHRWIDNQLERWFDYIIISRTKDSSRSWAIYGKPLQLIFNPYVHQTKKLYINIGLSITRLKISKQICSKKKESYTYVPPIFLYTALHWNN